jgi:hypothetical protein
MKSMIILCVFACLLAAAVATVRADSSAYVPADCVSMVTVSNIQSDPGISWMLGSWINSPRQSPLRELLKVTKINQISVAVLPSEGDSDGFLLCVIDPGQKTRLDMEKVANVILPEPEARVQSLAYRGSTIFYTQSEEKEDFSAYAITPDRLLLYGSHLDVLKKSLDGPSVVKSAGYQKAVAYFPRSKDGMLFADNSGARFVEFLQPLEKKWNMTLLLSAEYLDWMGSTFDMIDSNRAAGTFVFQGADTGHMDEIKDDAEFLGEAFKRKFMAEKIDYTSAVEVKGSSVVLNMQIEGLEPLWKKLFEQGVLSLIRPGE